MFKGVVDFIQSLSATSIEVYEFKQSEVRRGRLLKNSSLNDLIKSSSKLSFNGYMLAHAVVKADYLDQRNLIMPGIGFLLQACNIIDLSVSSIELKQRASKVLNDFSLTSMVGRVGQGLAILYAHHLGLKFAAHLRSHVESLPSGSTAARHRQEAMADFLFANDKKTILVESKGSFSQKKNIPSEIKKVLKLALEKQVDPWMTYLQPAPSNGYVFYSCLREKGGEPSAMFVVDPEGGAPETSDIEQIVRENYGAWFRAMGMADSAERLLNPLLTPSTPVEYLFLIFEINSRKYAFPDFLMFPGYCGVAMGIDLYVLNAISSVIYSDNKSLQELLQGFDTSSEFFENISIFPDGSVFGLISVENLSSCEKISL